MTTLPIRNLTTSFWLRYAPSTITPFPQRQGVIVEGAGDQGMSVLTASGRAGLDLVGDDLVVTGSNIHFWDASSIVGGVPQKCQKLAANNSLHGTAPNAMYMRSTSDNGTHNHESFRWFFNGSTADNNNGNCAAQNNFGVGVATDIWSATAAVNVFTLKDGTAPSSATGYAHVYSLSGQLRAMAQDGSGSVLTSDPRFSKFTSTVNGPVFDLYHNKSTSAAASDITVNFRSRGKNASGTEISYSELRTTTLDVTAGSEDSQWSVWSQVAGASAARVYVQAGFSVGTATDPGAGGLMLKPPSSITPAVNGELTFEATSNTTMTVKFKGSDGTVRTSAITLV